MQVAPVDRFLRGIEAKGGGVLVLVLLVETGVSARGSVPLLVPLVGGQVNSKGDASGGGACLPKPNGANRGRGVLYALKGHPMLVPLPVPVLEGVGLEEESTWESWSGSLSGGFGGVVVGEVGEEVESRRDLPVDSAEMGKVYYYLGREIPNLELAIEGAQLVLPSQVGGALALGGVCGYLEEIILSYVDVYSARECRGTSTGADNVALGIAKVLVHLVNSVGGSGDSEGIVGVEVGDGSSAPAGKLSGISDSYTQSIV
ncbi:hypothetical protein V495_00153 [Pseudogymnoascus sp. VKM F-4514 (FW-929)]|nr:hypothetical protein V495_00153 [Pseudogymnoascus sp. VKM F-4514 (FW-929)]